jgi:phosphoglycerol transferase MdoB-like AlkP superfamily enzyme
VLWESLNSKLLSNNQNGRPVIGGIQSFSKQGIFFSRVYSAGTRTTNALVATLSGLPSHPTSNALASSRRSAQLPSLAAALSRAGYHTGFYYGGSLAFDNRGRYLLTGHYDKIVEKHDFEGEPPMSPWGVHDSIVLDRLFRDLDTASVPVLAATLTLSSHEPYTVPGSPTVIGNAPEKQFLNAQAYTDRAVSTFLTRLRKTSRWDSTLVVILGDHGSMFPLDTTSFWGAPREFNIPMIWVGGALAAHGLVIDAIGSQADVPALLLDQLGLDRSAFRWSKDFIIPRNAQFAYFAFPNAFGFVDPHGSYVFDNLSRKIVFRTGDQTAASVTAGRAFQQKVTESYETLAKSTVVAGISQ